MHFFLFIHIKTRQKSVITKKFGKGVFSRMNKNHISRVFIVANV